MKPKAKAPLRCLLVDDHAIMRDGLRSLLEKQPGFKVVGEAGDGGTAVRLAQQLAPDVVIMDVTMPELNGIDATRRIRSAKPAPKVVCLSMHAQRGIVRGMLQAGASGYLLKSGAARELIAALRMVMSGGTYLSPPIAAEMVEDHVREGGRSRPLLTTRERQVLGLISEGCHTKEIADRLKIGIKTVFTHRQRMMRKLRVDSNVALLKYAVGEGLAEM